MTAVPYIFRIASKYIHIFKTGSHVQLWLVRVLYIDQAGLKFLPAAASQVQGSKAYATSPGNGKYFQTCTFKIE